MVEKKREYQFFGVVTIAVILLDQLMKWLVLRINPLWDWTFFEIHLVTNTGAGFGILHDKTMLLAMFSLLVAIVIVWNYRKIPKERFAQFCVALFLGGVLGNFIDRAFRGLVIDFIDFKFWPAFNVADSAISFAVDRMIWFSWRMEKRKNIMKK